MERHRELEAVVDEIRAVASESLRASQRDRQRSVEQQESRNPRKSSLSSPVQVTLTLTTTLASRSTRVPCKATLERRLLASRKR